MNLLDPLDYALLQSAVSPLVMFARLNYSVKRNEIHIDTYASRNSKFTLVFTSGLGLLFTNKELNFDVLSALRFL